MVEGDGMAACACGEIEGERQFALRHPVSGAARTTTPENTPMLARSWRAASILLGWYRSPSRTSRFARHDIGLVARGRVLVSVIGPISTRGPAVTWKLTSSAWSACGTRTATGGSTLRQGVAILPQRAEHRAAGTEHGAGLGRLAGMQGEGALAGGGHGAGQADPAQVEERAFVDVDVDGGGRFGGSGGKLGRQVRIVQPVTGDGDGDPAIVVAETVERGFQAGDILARAGDDGERARGGTGAQADELEAAGNCRIEGGDTGRLDFHRVAERVGGAGAGGCEKRHDKGGYGRAARHLWSGRYPAARGEARPPGCAAPGVTSVTERYAACLARGGRLA